MVPDTAKNTNSFENLEYASLGSILTACLDMLKIENREVRKKAVEFLERVPAGTVNAYGKWITSIKTIADSCTVNGVIFSHSEVCDFLTVAVKGIDRQKLDSKTVRDATFNIYKDIMESYQLSDEKVKLHYPRIILDVVSIMDKGIDTSGQRVGIYGIERYYQSRKTKAPLEDPVQSYLIDQKVLQVTDQGIAKSNSNRGSQGDYTSVQENPLPTQYSAETIESLHQITRRDKKQLEKSLSTLQSPDVRKISSLCQNYNRLERYNRLIGSPEFKTELERELHHSLTDNQLQHASNSVKKAKIYVESILDGKFVPHGTHGINHVKHNLEYGYQVMGLLEPRKRRS